MAKQAHIQTPLVQHDWIWKTTDIPLFFGNKAKEIITPQQLVERLEMVATVANWADDKKKCAEFFLCLREDMLSWYNTLDHIIVFDKKVWAEVKREFLAAYAHKYSDRRCVSASRTCTRSQMRLSRSYTKGSPTCSSTCIKPSRTTLPPMRVT
jgi:hypothetical protein